MVSELSGRGKVGLPGAYPSPAVELGSVASCVVFADSVNASPAGA